MDIAIFVAILGALINWILASLVPIALKKTNQTLLEDIKTVYQTHGNLIIASSIIVFITIYLSLKFTPYVNLKLSEVSGINLVSDLGSSPVNLGNLAQLNFN